MAPASSDIFRTKDSATGRDAFLRSDDWIRHVRKRPELLGQEQSVRRTVEDPHIAIRTDDGAIYKYRLGHGRGKTKGTYLQVVERGHDNDSDRVRTAWFTGEIREGQLLRFRHPEETGNG